MSIMKAAEQVLSEAGGPLRVNDILDRILQRGLWTPKGATPEASLHARLAREVKHRGAESKFVRTAPATFALRSRDGSAGGVAAPQAKAAPQKPKPSSKHYSFTDCAEKVLEKFGGKKPMHYKAMTDKALELGWLKTEGKTPEASMYAQVLTEVKRKKKRGEQPRFVLHGRGFIGLMRWMGTGLAFQIEQHNRNVRKALHARLVGLTPTAFGELIARLLAELGFEDVQVTQRTKDGGIDVRGVLVVGEAIRTNMAVQVKRWKPGNNVQAPIVQQVRGSLGSHDQGLIITTSDFSAGARAEAERANAIPVGLMNGEQLVALLVEHDLGISRDQRDIVDLDEEFFSPDASRAVAEVSA